MDKKAINVVTKVKRPVLRYKMYKDGKLLVTAGVLGLATLTLNTTAHADVTVQSNSDTTGSQSVSNGINAVAATTSSQGSNSSATAQQITTPVNVDHSALDAAVDQAKQAGVQVNAKPTDTKTVPTSDIPNAKSAIASDYQQQTSQVNQVAKRAAHAHENYNTYNNTKGDTSALDQAVSKAKGTEGLTVIKDADHNSSPIDPSDDQGIQDYENSRKQDYSNQVTAINNDAIVTQEKNNQRYNSELDEYNRKLQQLSNEPAIKTNGNVKLVGTPGTPGSIAYYGGITAINTNPGTIALSRIGWNSDTQLIGTTKKATYKDATASHLSTGDINSFYDITDIIRNNGSITLTNVAVDQYGRKYDLHITFANTDGGDWGNSVKHISNAMVGPDYDGSIQFDYYGGFEVGTGNGNGINMSDMYFSLHGGSTPVNVFTNVLFSDLDGYNQEFDTNLGNIIAWTPSDSKIVQNGNTHFSATQGNLEGFNSSPNGTGVLLGQSDHYYYHFGAKGTPDPNWGNDTGVQFNLFGQSAQVKSLIHPTRNTTSVHYHNDVTKVTPPTPANYQVDVQYHNLNATTTPDKNWVDNKVTVNGKTYIDDDLIHAQVNLSLPDLSGATNKLNNVQLIDDYSNFADKAKTQSITVTENGKDVTADYNIVDQNGHITATRKDPVSAPTGTAQLNVTWKINHDVAAGTRLHNSGMAVINNSSANTNQPDIVTYTPQTGKHWVEGSQVVDSKTYINNDIATGQVTMSLPDPAQLANPLSKVVVADDYSQLARYASYVDGSAQVLENGKDVTSQYNITSSNNQIIATRKDPASTPAGSVSLKAQFKIFEATPSGTKLINSGWGTINSDTVPTNTPSIVTYKQTTDKHWTEGTQIVDGKVYVDGDQVHTDVTMSLPDPNSLAKKLTHVSVTDDYSKFANDVDYESATITENGKNVTDQYTIANGNGQVTATRKDAGSTPQGTVDLHVNFKIHSDVPSETVLVNSGNGQINDSIVKTPDRTISVFKQETNKTWQEGDQVVNGKLYIDNDLAHSQISTTLPDPAQLANKLSSVVITDDFSAFSKYVDVKDVKIQENGNEATNLYDIQVNAQNGTIVATRKEPALTPKGSATMFVTFKVHDDVPSGTQLVNKGSVKINNETVPTPTPSVETYKPDTDKHWVAGTQVVDGKTFIDNDNVTGEVTMSLPDPSQLANKLTNVTVVDDYSKFAQDTDYQSAKVFENGQDVTSQYNISDKNGKVTAVRKDPSATPGGQVKLQVVWKVHTDVATGTKLVNSGSGTINSETVPTPDRTIVTYKPDTDKHWVEGSQIVDGKTFIDGDNVTGEVSMSLPQPNELAQKLSNVTVIDDYSKFSQDADYQSAKVFENGQDVTSQYNISDKDGKVTAVRKDPSATPGGQVKLQVVWKVHTDVATGTKLVNSGSGTINSETVPTPDRTIVTYKQDTDKHWYGQNGQVVDGKVTLDGDTVSARINMTLPKRSDMGGKFSKIQLTDDYSRFADKVKVKDVHVYENGKDMTSEYNITIENGKVIATRKNPDGIDNNGATLNVTSKALNAKALSTNLLQAFAVANANGTTTSNQATQQRSNQASNFETGAGNDTGKQDQASNGGNVTLNVDFQINDNVPSGTKLENYGSGTINNETVDTNHPTITTWKPEAIKDVVISVDNQKSLNNSNIALNQEFDYKLTGGALPQNLEEPINEYGFSDDYDQTHDQYNGQYSVLLDTDVTLKDGTVLKKNTDIKQYTTQVIDTQNGAVNIEVNRDFLNKIDFDKSGFQASAYLDMKRIKSGVVYNKYTNTINGKKYISNTVKTTTTEPKKEKPVTPSQPSSPANPVESSPSQAPISVPVNTPASVSVSPEKEAQQLPQTGNQENDAAMVGLALLGIVGSTLLPMRKKRYTE